MADKTTQQIGFELSVSGGPDGRIEAMYIRFKDGKVARTVEAEQDAMFIDYDSKGNVLGIEVISPVELSQLASVVGQPQRKPFRSFLRRSAPPELLITS